MGRDVLLNDIRWSLIAGLRLLGYRIESNLYRCIVAGIEKTLTK